MAKSKTGGTRAFIRGRIGSDVYSIGKTSKGARQQVVRSLAEQVSNPRTQEQMKGRMIMSTVMQAVSALQPIIDHSFDGLPVGQPSISEFIRRNYALVKDDVAAHPNGGNHFGLVKYQEKGVKVGDYVVSSGKAVLPSIVKFNSNFVLFKLGEGNLTVGKLKSGLGLSVDGYLTAVMLDQIDGFVYARFRLTTTLSDDTAITSQNIDSLFTIESNVTVTPSIYENDLSFELAATANTYANGVIVSEKENGAWIHNDCVLAGDDFYDYQANVALPTYPVGAEQFLNGGNL